MLFVDAHSHVTPFHFPSSPSDGSKPRWPCMRCESAAEGTMLVGDAPFRKLDSRSWDVGRRIEDLDRAGIGVQVLSPMPELLSYWLAADDAGVMCDVVNQQIAEMVAAAPKRLRGLGAVTLQDPTRAAAMLPRLKTVFNLSGVEIGSNIHGLMLGDPAFDPFWAAAEAEGMAVFVHALHPVAAKSLPPSVEFTGYALFPVDVGMGAASLLIGGVLDRFPRLRLGFSHGGGVLPSILGRLDLGWRRTEGFGGKANRPPSEQARRLFYDSNVYDPRILRYLATDVAPRQVFAGTDYPYEIMQTEPVAFIREAGLTGEDLDSISFGAASRYLNEDLGALRPR